MNVKVAVIDGSEDAWLGLLQCRINAVNYITPEMALSAAVPPVVYSV